MLDVTLPLALPASAAFFLLLLLGLASRVGFSFSSIVERGLGVQPG